MLPSNAATIIGYGLTSHGEVGWQPRSLQVENFNPIFETLSDIISVKFIIVKAALVPIPK